MVRLATEAVLNGNQEEALKVIAMDDEVDGGERRIVHKATLAVMSEQPVASDLRFLVASFNAASEVEKVGDDAVKMARRVARIGYGFPAEMKLTFTQLSEKARLSFSTAMRLCMEYDAVLAEELVASDAEIDRIYGEARTRCEALIRENPDHAEVIIKCMEAFRSLEHVADRAVAVANRLRIIYDPAPIV